MSLSWKDRPLTELIRLSWPITISTVSYSVMTLVDTLLVGHLGRAQLAGVGLAGITCFVLLCFSFGLMQGAKVLVSQAIGANRREEAQAYLAAAVSLALGIGVATILVGQGVAIFIGRLAASEAAGAAARTYLQIRILGAPLVLLFVALKEVRYAEGDARTPMRADVIANVVNIALAVLFIFVLKMGVGAAAFATILAHAVEAGILVWGQRSRGFGYERLAKTHVVELLRVGLPTGLQFTLEVGAFATLSLIISLFSEVEMAAHQIAIQVIHFSFLPALAVAEAASVLAGQSVGAGRYPLVNRVSRLALGLTSSYAAAWSLALAVASHAIASAFTPDAAVADEATKLLHVAAVFQMFDAANIVARCTLRGAGDVRYAAIVGVLSSWLCTPPLAWVLGRRYGLGAVGGWMGLCLEIFVSAGLLWWRLERRGWTLAATRARDRLEGVTAGSPPLAAT
jgi:multidrug resistance protein, MATE family